MRAIKWLVVNGVFAAFLWLGLVEEVKGAQNVAIAMAWIAVVTVPAWFVPGVEKIIRKRGRAVPALIDACFDLGVVAILIWHGWIVTGVAYLLQLLVQQAAIADALGELDDKP